MADESQEFHKLMGSLLDGGTVEVRLRPDVEPLRINQTVLDANKETITTMLNLVLGRLERRGVDKPTAHLRDGFPFSYLSGCFTCGYVVFDQMDPEDRCPHCLKGQAADLYVSRKEAFVLVAVGKLLGRFSVYPDPTDTELWRDDVGRGTLAAFPMLMEPQPPQG